MAALIAFLATILLAGGFLWMKPSPREQRLAKLRAEAYKYNLLVTSIKVADTSEFGRVNDRHCIETLYQIPLVLNTENPNAFVVLRTTGEAGLYLPDGWQWEESVALTDEQLGLFSQYLAELPSSITLIALRNDSVGLTWDEKDPAVTFDVMKSWLIKFAKVVDRAPVSSL